MSQKLLTVTNIEQIDKNIFNQFIENNEKSSFFHSIDYYTALKKAKLVDPFFIAILDKKNVLGMALGEISNEIRILPYLTKRTIFYSEPLYSDLHVLNLILGEIVKRSKGLFSQFRPFFSLTHEEKIIYSSYGFEESNHLNAYIPLHQNTNIFDNFYKDKRKGIRKAKEKYCLEIKEFDNVVFAVNTFYQIQKVLFKKKRHVIKSKDYFFHLLNESSGKAHMVFAFYQGQPIATQLFTISKTRLTALYTATLPEHLNKHAGDLLILYLINTALKIGVQIFDFGGGGNPDKEYSPRKYKERFGTIFNNIGRYTFSKSNLYKFAMKLHYRRLKN